ncbi:MAG: type II CAAX prenyl endopeptidase Rce1 family protein [Saprospiraceae bacterium]
MFFIVFFAEIIIAGLLFNLIGFDTDQHKMNVLLDQFDKWQILLIAVIIAPIVEEFIFRYYITKPLLFLLGVPMLLAVIPLVNAFGGVLHWYLALPISLIAIAVFLLISFQSELRNLLLMQYLVYFPYIVYFSAALFAFIHIFNFGGELEWYSTPILVFPQFVVGLFLAYVRVRNGIFHCVLIHAINNLIPILAIFLVPNSALQGY